MATHFSFSSLLFLTYYYYDGDGDVDDDVTVGGTEKWGDI